MRPIELRVLALHLLRITVVAGVLAFGPPLLVVEVGAATLLFFGAFALAHDLAHGALRLPRYANEMALALAASLLLVSGHGMRLMHLRHHRRPMANDDFEGIGARRSLVGALLHGPSDGIRARVEAFREAGKRGRAWQAAENAGILAGIAWIAWTGARAGVVYVAVAGMLTMTMGVWASHVPHNAAPWLVRLARRLSVTGSPVMASLGYHAEHHARPAVACGRLWEGS